MITTILAYYVVIINTIFAVGLIKRNINKVELVLLFTFILPSLVLAILTTVR